MNVKHRNATNLDIEQKKLEELTNELVETRNKQVTVDKLNKSIQLENDKLLADCKKCEEYSMKIGNVSIFELFIMQLFTVLKSFINDVHVQ